MEEISTPVFENSSFRDQHGRVFFKDNEIYRLINVSYQRQYDHLINSGLYDELVKERLLIPHREVTNVHVPQDGLYKIIKPETVPVISYPTEWCFSQLKDAALTTLSIQLLSLKYGMILKDSSAFNIQFYQGRPVFIDTLSFDFYKEGSPWIAYKQFCEHFLAPLCLIAYRDPFALRLFTIEGIPLPLAAKLLPVSKKINLNILIHIVLHARAQHKYREEKVSSNRASLFNVKYLERLTQNLIRSVEKINYRTSTTWDRYYVKDVADSYFAEKFAAVETLINKINPKSVWDVGGNNGTFSQISARKQIFTISTDFDFSSIEESYLWVKKQSDTFLLPLVIDITNPTSATGWVNKERRSFLSRVDPQAMLMLAIIHHLVISAGIPLESIAKLAHEKCKHLIIEFVPKADPMVKKLLQNREDIFDDYTASGFETAFSKYFRLVERIEFPSSMRTLYHFTSID